VKARFSPPAVVPKLMTGHQKNSALQAEKAQSQKNNDAY
jgi:hypothetical protein